MQWLGKGLEEIGDRLAPRVQVLPRAIPASESEPTMELSQALAGKHRFYNNSQLNPRDWFVCVCEVPDLTLEIENKINSLVGSPKSIQLCHLVLQTNYLES